MWDCVEKRCTSSLELLILFVCLFIPLAKLRLWNETCGKTNYEEFLGNSAPNEVTE